MIDVVIDNVIRSQVVEDYISFFENKNIEVIENLFADDCSLTDWNFGEISGKENVINVFKKIFESFEKIKTETIHIHEDHDGIIILEMILFLDNEEMLVADIFEFDKDDKIKALRAYKGN